MYPCHNNLSKTHLCPFLKYRRWLVMWLCIFYQQRRWTSWAKVEVKKSNQPKENQTTWFWHFPSPSGKIFKWPDHHGGSSKTAMKTPQRQDVDDTTEGSLQCEEIYVGGGKQIVEIVRNTNTGNSQRCNRRLSTLCVDICTGEKIQIVHAHVDIEVQIQLQTKSFCVDMWEKYNCRCNSLIIDICTGEKNKTGSKIGTRLLCYTQESRSHIYVCRSPKKNA